MINRKTKPTLEELRVRLAGGSMEMPARATRFHALRVDLDHQVASALKRFLGPGDDEIAALRGQVDRLCGVASALAALIHRAEALETEVRDLRSRAEQSTDRDLAGWLTDRCIDWQSTLRRLGSNVEREAELEQDQTTLERTQNRIRDHDGALRRLEEAQQLLIRLGSKMETAALRADLPLLRRRLFEEGASAIWIADLDQALRPAAQAAAELKPKAPPQTLQQVPALLYEVRRWASALHSGEEEELAITEQLRLAEDEWEHWTDAQIAELLSRASQLLETLRRKAAETRSAALAQLRERRRQLARACGGDEELDRALGDLEASESSEPGTFEEWMEQRVTVHRLLLHAASARLGDLQEWLLLRIQELARSIEALGREPLSNRVATETERLRLDLSNLPDPRAQEEEEIFHSLGICDQTAVALERLGQQAQGDREALRGVQQRLLARHQALRDEVARSGIEILDLGPRIQALATAEPGASIDVLRHDAESLELELGAREKEFAARCAAWIAERLPAFQSLTDVLQRGGRAPRALPELPEEGSPPSRWTRAVVAVRGLEEELTGQRERLQNELEERCDEFRGRLGQLPLASLRPEVRRDAADLSRWLGEQSWNREPTAEDRVRKLLDGLARCELFLTRLSQEDREAQERAEALGTKLREFNEGDLDRYCPDELVQRLSALVAGLPAEPRRWGEIAEQLDEAEGLLELLGAHATRVLAVRLEQAIRGLERQATTTKDPGFARRIRSLLTELAARDEHEAVPAELAAQILLLAPEGVWEGGA